MMERGGFLTWFCVLAVPDPISEFSDDGPVDEGTQTKARNPPRSITKGRPKEIRYKSGLEIQAKHKKTKKGTGAVTWSLGTFCFVT